MNWLNYYLESFLYSFNNSPFALRITIILIIFFSLLCASLFIKTISNYFKEKRTNFKVENDEFYVKLEEIITRSEALDYNELTTELESTKEINSKKNEEIIETLLQIKRNNINTFNYENSQKLIQFFNLNEYWNVKLSDGNLKEKMNSLQNIIELNAKISESSLSNLVYHNNNELRKRARIAQIHLSLHDPFKFFEEEFDKNFTEWDKIKIHNILLHRSSKTIPNFAYWISRSKNEDLKCLFIFEIGFYKQYENRELLVNLYKTTTSDKIKIQILETLKILKIDDYKNELIDNYFSSSVAVKLELIKTLQTVESPNKLLSFFTKSFNTAYNTDLKIAIGKVIFNCGLKGKEIIQDLENKASEGFETLVFEHIKNPLIND